MCTTYYCLSIDCTVNTKTYLLIEHRSTAEGRQVRRQIRDMRPRLVHKPRSVELLGDCRCDCDVDGWVKEHVADAYILSMQVQLGSAWDVWQEIKDVEDDFGDHILRGLRAFGAEDDSSDELPDGYAESYAIENPGYGLP